MTLCRNIAGTINRSDFARFNETFRNEKVAHLIQRNPIVQACLRDLSSREMHSTQKMASAANQAFNSMVHTDVVQVIRSGYGYIVKTGGAPMVGQPQQVQMGNAQAQATLPPEVLQQADQQGVATVTNVQAAPDPLVEKAEPAVKFGIYKVINAMNNREALGFVIPQLFNPLTGAMVPQALFTNGSAYAIQPAIVGKLTTVSFNLPSTDVPRGLGVFYKTNGTSIVATVPFNIISEMSVQGQRFFAAKTTDGLEVQISTVPNQSMPLMAAQGEIAMPADFKFLPLDNPIQISMGDNMLKQAQAESYGSMAVIKAFRDGTVSLSGPVFEKVGSGEHKITDGLYYLAAAGCPQNLSLAVMEKAATEQAPVRLFGLQPLYTVDEFRKYAADEAAHILSHVQIPERLNLLEEVTAISMSKEASSMLGVATVDSVLSLNFLNPENIQTYVEHLPQLEESVKVLAKLVLAAQMGLQTVPIEAARRAMEGLDKTIKGLNALKSYAI